MACRELAALLGQFQGLALVHVQPSGVGPVHAGSGNAIERGDSVPSAAAGCITLSVGDGDPGVGRSRWLIGRGEDAGESGVRHVRSPGC